MGAAYFYHLTEATAEEALAMLLPRAAQAGWRVEVRGTDPARMDALDAALWDGPADSFNAHGRAGGPHDALQPVLLTAGEAAEGIACLMALDGAGVTAGEAAALQRVCILFDGHDPAAVQAARVQWRTLTGAGIAAQYWAQEDGRWTKKAEG
ncbi:DNA polymerase III subunit chi [Wenxinia saemankumensis]|uniref:DNA polymerase III, chi subunit n=1 Tax=Wenxinia saemankumensis TaxID=1447782 RepID=A0A1M6HH67_9RHOB|nr:DNA polymerase III subunit chi [Wenxinia saemankumensis]SHJ21525.1 DNA polymerase III, chi subunit [Wenxinia saemankumensis]